VISTGSWNLTPAKQPGSVAVVVIGTPPYAALLLAGNCTGVCSAPRVKSAGDDATQVGSPGTVICPLGVSVTAVTFTGTVLLTNPVRTNPVSPGPMSVDVAGLCRGSAVGSHGGTGQHFGAGGHIYGGQAAGTMPPTDVATPAGATVNTALAVTPSVVLFS
jgi:hypothetical protein